MSAGKQCKEAMQKLRLAEFERDQAVLRAARTEAERARAEKFWASAQERAEKMEAERDALRTEVERLQREQFGTPCKCEEWVKACGLAEARAEQVEAVLEYAEKSRRKAIAGDGYGLLHSHIVLAMLNGEKYEPL